MKTPPSKGKASGLTLIELLVIIAVIAVLAAFILPTYNGPRRAYRTLCMSNLKQVDLALNIFAGDNGGKFPMEVTVTNGGTMEFIYSDHVFPHFQKALKGLRQPNEKELLKILACPKDTTRQVATNYEALNDLNISYFLNADASLINNPSQTILAGERDLSLNHQPAKAGLLTVTTNIDLNWTGEFHPKGGNLAFADGHVEWSKADTLNSWIQKQPLAINRFCVP